MNYSQNNEQEILLNYFKNKTIEFGFLDIGAYNGKDLSNTRAMALEGWKGVCIEPSPKVFVDLAKLYEGNKNIELINGAVDVYDEWANFYDTNGDAISTTEEEHLEKWKVSAVFNRPFTIKKIALKDVAEKFGTTWDFVNIDTEGAKSNLRLFKEACELLSFDCICVEHDRNIEEMTILARLKGLGRTILVNGENIIFAK